MTHHISIRVETKSPMTLTGFLVNILFHAHQLYHQSVWPQQKYRWSYIFSINRNIYRLIWPKLSMSCDGLFLFLFGFKHALLPAQMPSLLELAASHNGSTAGHIGIFVLCFFHHYSSLHGVGRLFRRAMHSRYRSNWPEWFPKIINLSMLIAM